MNTSIARQIARIILEGFSDYRTRFTDITLGARDRFLKADWSAAQNSASDRINLYYVAVTDVMETLTSQVEESWFRNSDCWQDVHNAYLDLISYRTDPELAETFYNSIYRKVFKGEAVNPRHCFIQSEFDGFKVQSARGIYRSYFQDKYQKQGLVSLVGQILDDFQFELPWEYRRRDIRNIIHALQKTQPSWVKRSNVRVDVLKWVFFRNKAAYLVGRLVAGDDLQPFVLAVLNNEQGELYVDALLCENDCVSVLFSFTRSYFLVDARIPSECIEFLQTLIPEKNRAELYNSIGFFKHGKSVFYRDFLKHLQNSSDQFVIAPGVKGMVMSVFTLPSLDMVFKVIKDRFAPPKDISKAMVKDRYYLVKTHDRVGRMADTQEYSNLILPRFRFSDELLEELQQVAPSTVIVYDDKVLIRHLYTERRMMPMNIYVEQLVEDGNEQALDDVLNEYGRAIKQLAAANIFPGDMLLKNFGVTRHGRVVFYDYDEIIYLTECNFRDIPEALYPEQELSAEPWYSVSPGDIFPEEFPVFLFPDLAIRKRFNRLHGDLFTASYWRSIQQQITNGQVMDVLPYSPSLQLKKKYSDRPFHHKEEEPVV
ncbi:bifunctional isocitrate dehydrogenase kinase/phosphatase [Endozoicomonas elysicola]|uniref:Isocitrate dehydrogenase kinase/phosphatase n=1 Tax=Endozoicomonas elysicola TaxID=305900 RepID=A0A081KDZ9_9GAMM|nr:bifunctional isocitrate dehydrogenase kinase/phosphatase [Endozoicomonas elysicola]KEI72375.1 isocitrate dehydrogenase [Endozoicomonas elysicola]